MTAFAEAALPWVAMGVALAVVLVSMDRARKQKK